MVKRRLGAHLAGQALTLSGLGLGLVHGLGHAITARTGTPHGVALAAVLEEVIAYNLPAAETAYDQAARALRARPAAGLDATSAEWALAAIDSVREISGAVAVKRALAELGLDEALLLPVAGAALADAVTRNNPRTPTEPEVLELLRPLLQCPLPARLQPAALTR